ncbi:hypothetical protein DPEC_G00081930, partial [Dallia pectoralis]
MGCNLCTLQKQEEHYKLLYEIAQVNARDYTKAGRDEASEPVMVQVLRRHGNPPSHAQTTQEVHVVNVCTQTDITFEHIMALAKLRPATPPVPDICPFLLSDSCHSIHTIEHDFYECPEFLPADVERPDDYEYEEVELCRINSQEKLGLTLCYRTDDEEDTAIYVSQVGANSIAARDGRIRAGDRILQVNGCDIQDRQKAVALLSSEESRSIVLLVTRPEDTWLDEERSDLLEELKIQILEEQRKEEAQKLGTGEEQAMRLEDEDPMTDTATCSSNTQDKDSGMGTTRNEESSEQEVLLARIHRRPIQGLRDKWRSEQGQRLGQGRRTAVPVNTQVPGHTTQGIEGEVGMGLECDGSFQQLLELKCQIRNGGECGVYYSRRSTIECSLTEQSGVGVGTGGVEQELRLLNEELHSIELECQSIMQAHQLRKPKTQRDHLRSPVCSPGRSPKDGRKQHAKLADINEHPGEKQFDSDKLRGDKDSSSAYNTAESARSTPLGMERSPDHSLQRRINLTNQKNLRSTMTASGLSISFPITARSPEGGTSTLTPTRSRQNPNPSPGSTVISSSPDQSNPSPSESDPALPADDERCDR